MNNKFKKEIISGIFYTGIGKYTSLLISLIVTAILARLLSPDDFGIIAIATIIITFFNMISEIGIAPAIVQYKNLSLSDINNIFSFTVYIGIFVSIFYLILVPFIAEFYNDIRLLDILKYLSLSLLFSTINIVPNAMFYKEKKFKIISIRTFFIQLIVGVFSVLVALAGGGVYSLLVAPILSNLILLLVGLYYYPQKFLFMVRIEPIQKIFSYSCYQFLYNIINYLTRNLDKLLIGKYIDMTSLGYYEKSYRLMMLPLSNISGVINPVLHPILVDYQEDKEEMERKYCKLIQILSYIGVYFTVVLFFGGKELIMIVFGEQWLPSVDVFQILSLSVVIQLLMSPCGAIYQATNSTKYMFFFSAISIITTILGFIIAIFFWKSIQSVAYSYCITLFINFFLGYYIIYNKIFKMYFVNFIRIFRHSLIMLLMCFLSLFGSMHLFRTQNIYLDICIVAILALVFMFLYMLLFNIFDIRNVLKRNMFN